MTSMGDIGRELGEIQNHPTPSKPQSELDRLEARLHDFFAWAHGQPHAEIRDKFASEFTEEPLHDQVVAKLAEGKGAEVREQIPVTPDDSGSGAASS